MPFTLPVELAYHCDWHGMCQLQVYAKRPAGCGLSQHEHGHVMPVMVRQEVHQKCRRHSAIVRYKSPTPMLG